MKTRIDWEFYLNRRRSNLNRFVRNRGIHSYKQLCEVCDSLKITRPPEEVTEGMFMSPKVTKANDLSDSGLKKSKVKKSTSRRGRKKKEK